MMIDPRISGAGLAISLVIISGIILAIDNCYFASRVSALLRRPKVRLLIMALIFMTVMLGTIFGHI